MHIYSHMRCTLRAVDNNNRAKAVRPVSHLSNRIHASKNIGHMSDSKQLRVLVDSGIDGLVSQRSILLTVEISESCACDSGCHLPWKHIAVVLHDGDRYLVAGFQVVQCIAVCHKIKALRGVPCEDYFLLGIRMDEISHNLSGTLITLCRLKTEWVEASERIRIALLVERSLSVYNHLWLLCCGRIVYICCIVIPQ